MADAIDDVAALLKEFTRSDVRELHLRTPDFELFLSNDPGATARSASASSPLAAPAPASPPVPAARPVAAAPPPPAQAARGGVPSDAIIVVAPNLGTFYRAPKPGAPDYVAVGSLVTAESELCLIEVMKLFTAVRAGTGGKVHAVLAEDGAMVEAGQPLFAIVRE